MEEPFADAEGSFVSRAFRHLRAVDFLIVGQATTGAYENYC